MITARVASLALVVIGVVGVVGGWVFAGVPQNAREWFLCALVHVMVAASAAFGAYVWWAHP